MGMKQCGNNSSDDENREMVLSSMLSSHKVALEHEIDLVRDVIEFALGTAARAYGFSGKELADEPSQHKTDVQEHDAWRRARATAFFALKESAHFNFSTIARILFQDRVGGGDVARFYRDCFLPLYHSDSEFRDITDSVISQVSEYADAAGLDCTLASSWWADNWRKSVDAARAQLN